MMRRTIIHGLALAAALLFPRAAQALTYEEHCALSNRALTLALRHALAAQPGRPALGALQAERLWALAHGSCSPANPATYGDLVALADFSLSPVEYYSYEPGHTTLPLLLQYDDIPWKSLAAMGNRRLQNLRAAHLNDDHFQERAVLSHIFWHGAAVQAAAVERRLLGALVLNAFADHFLQDFFAPGHVRTPRRRLHDIAALGLHDGHNRRGGTFYLDAGRMDELAPLLALLGPGERRACAELRVRPCLLRLARGVHMRGDAQACEDSAQELVLTLVTARSIADVLAAFASGRPESRFDDGVWGGYRVDVREERIHIRGGREIETRYRLATPEAHMAYGRFGTDEHAARATAELGVAISMGTRVPVGGGGEPDARLAAEMMVFSLTPASEMSIPRRFAVRQFAVAASYTVDLGEHRPVHGVAGRVIVPVVELNSQVSLGGGLRLPPRGPGDGQVAYAWEGRLESGFGLAFIGVTFGREFHQVSGTLEKRWILGSTLSMGTALSSFVSRVGLGVD
jgi:hypothetical protein